MARRLAPRVGDRAPREDRPRREASQPRRDDDAPVIGLGDHVPDFLLRPVKARARAAPRADRSGRVTVHLGFGLRPEPTEAPMARLGLYPALIIVVFGVVAPFFIFRLGRFIGFAPLLALAFCPWSWLRRGKSRISWVANGWFGNSPSWRRARRLGRLRCCLSYSAASLIDRTRVIASQD